MKSNVLLYIGGTRYQNALPSGRTKVQVLAAMIIKINHRIIRHAITSTNITINRRSNIFGVLIHFTILYYNIQYTENSLYFTGFGQFLGYWISYGAHLVDFYQTGSKNFVH